MVLVEQQLWSTFYDAKTSLLEALNAAAARGFQIAPTNRALTRESALGYAEELVLAEKELEAVQRDIGHARDILRRQRIVAQRLRSPIGVLPGELIGEIITQTLNSPGDYTHIFTIMGISHMWRDTLLGMSRFFVKAGWDHWHPSLLDLWCKRAGNLPLIIELDNNTLYLISLFRKHGIWDVLEAFRSSWGYLSVSLVTEDQYIDPDSPSLRAIGALLAGRMDRLRFLHIDGPNEYAELLSFRLKAAHLSSLRSVVLKNIRIEFKGPERPDIVDLDCTPEYDDLWTEWAPLIRSFRSLTHLHLPFSSLQHHGGAHPQILHLPNLNALYLTDCDDVDLPEEGDQAVYFDLINAPNVDSLTLLALDAVSCGEMCDHVV